MSDNDTAPKAAHAYQWIGDMRPDGQPHFHLGNRDLPPADLSPEVAEGLTEFQLEGIARYAEGNEEGNPELYRPLSATEYNRRAGENDTTQRKWFQTLVQEAEEAGTAPPRPPIQGETQAEYMARMEKLAALPDGASETALTGETGLIDPGLQLPTTTTGEVPAEE